MTLPEDIIDFVRRNYPPQEQELALHALGTARMHDGTCPAPRLLRSAIVAGEYKREKGEWKRLRDLDLPFTKDDV